LKFILFYVTVQNKYILLIKMTTNWRESTDWKLFWLIENKDLLGLKNLCEKITSNELPKERNLYFAMSSWRDVFDQEEAKKIKVHLCGVTDFSAIQHCANLNWEHGLKCLYDYNVGTGCGLGLPCVIQDKFEEWYKNKYENINFKLMTEQEIQSMNLEEKN
jgi:hypothetical protein